MNPCLPRRCISGTALPCLMSVLGDTEVPPFLFSMSHNPIMSLMHTSKTRILMGKEGRRAGPPSPGTKCRASTRSPTCFKASMTKPHLSNLVRSKMMKGHGTALRVLRPVRVFRHTTSQAFLPKIQKGLASRFEVRRYFMVITEKNQTPVGITCGACSCSCEIP